MPISISIPTVEVQTRPRITVFGVGGAGGNAVNNMMRSNLEGVEFVVANTDAQALQGNLAQKRIQLGSTITRGLGAGSRPDVGRAAAEEQLEEILSHLDGTNMAFITAGMGGGTGTGAAPVIARAAREQGILTVGVVTKPFHFEGAHRMRIADQGIHELASFVDTLIIIPNQNLFRIANEKTTFADAFKMADDVLHAGVRGVTDLMVMPGLINLDFADIRTVMTEMGKAMMGTGEAGGDRRAIDAAEAAISNPLLDDVSMKGARGVLINITGGYDMTLFEVDEAANRIRDEVDPEANIIFGSTFDQAMDGKMRVSVVATGIDNAALQPRPGQQPTLHVISGRTAETRRAPSPVTTPIRETATRTAPPSPGYAGLTPAPVAPTGHGTAMAMAAAPLTSPALAGESVPVMQATVDPVMMPVESAQVAQAVDQDPAPTTERPESRLFEQAPARPAGSGPLRGDRREGAFIAPKAADAGPRLGAQTPERYNAPAQPAPDKGKPGLFQRMFGFGGASAPTAAVAAQPGVAAARHQPVTAPQTAAPSAAPTAAPTAAQSAPPQAPLAVEPAPRTKASAAEDDHLDIPAFLRRQAN